MTSPGFADRPTQSAPEAPTGPPGGASPEDAAGAEAQAGFGVATDDTAVFGDEETASSGDEEAAGTEETGTDPGTEGAAGPLPDVAGLAKERDEYLGALQRLQADFENYRKRVQRQQEDQIARGAVGLVNKLLPILDVLDLAESHLSGQREDPGTDEAKALLQARSLMVDTLAKEGLERIDRDGVPFDPEVHDAVAHAGEDPEGDGNGPVVEAVMRSGYRWRGQTIRPAMVRVRG